MKAVPLTPREIKFVKAKVQGKSNRQAALEATNVKTLSAAGVAATRMVSKDNVQLAIQQGLQKQGITLEAALAPIKEGLKANKVATVEGDFYETTVVDHTTRLKASSMALELMGAKQQVQAPQLPTEGNATNAQLLLEAIRSGDEVEVSRMVFNKRSE